jgi:hypothetical protein
VESMFINLGISALLEILQSKKSIDKWLRAIAKIYVAIHSAAQVYPALAAAIEKKMSEQ